MFDQLDDFLITRIAARVGEYENVPLRATCRRMRVIIPAPAKMTRNALLAKFAREQNIEGCVFARERGATDFAPMLFAAEFGNRQMCELALSWIGATGESEEPRDLRKLRSGAVVGDFGFVEGYENVILCAAARGGHLELCEFAISLDANNFEYMLIAAAMRGHFAICERAIELGASCFNDMLRYAAENNNRDICQLAISHGADVDNMLFGAAKSNIELCEMAIDLGAGRLNAALDSAISRDKYDICEFLINRGATNDEVLLRRAKYHGTPELFSLLFRYFPEMSGFVIGCMIKNRNEPECSKYMEIYREHNFVIHHNFALKRAAKLGKQINYNGIPESRVRWCELAKSYGANNFDEMLAIAARNEDCTLTKLAIEWGATCIDEVAGKIFNENAGRISEGRHLHIEMIRILVILREHGSKIAAEILKDDDDFCPHNIQK